MRPEIQEEIERHGTELSPAVAAATRDIYKKFYKDDPHREGVKQKLENIPYGPHEHHVLDLYLPKESSASRPSVIVYSHGGGLVAGDKSMHENIGNYFASYGLIAVINNYRLVPGVTYPGGGEDTQMLREWIYQNISKPEYGNGNPEKVVLMGQSAGGLHIATNLYAAGDPSRTGQNALSPPVAGIVYISTPFSFDKTPSSRFPVLKGYYGTDDMAEARTKTPVALVEKLPGDSPVLDPKILPTLIVVTQYESEEIRYPIFQFAEQYRYKSARGILPELTVIAGHNHTSNIFSIGTEDDVQGSMLREFVARVCSK